jgi:hypothetical protein
MAAALFLLAGCNLRLGGVTNTFGKDPTLGGPQPAMWASINGPYSLKQDGDPYSAKCEGAPVSATSCGDLNENTLYDATGYVYAVDVPLQDVGTPVTVSVYDPSFDNGDAAGDSYAASPFPVGFSTWYHLFDTTGNVNDVSTDPSLGMDTEGRCTSGTTGSHVFPPGTTSVAAWYDLCTFVPTRSGIYPLQVRSSDMPGVTDVGGGANSFSVRATATVPTQPGVYAIGRMSVDIPAVQNSTSGSGSVQINMVNVPAFWAGSTLLVDVFDPGDATAGNQYLQLLAPSSDPPSPLPTGGTTIACKYSDPSVSPNPETLNTSPICQVKTKDAGNGEALYNGRWLRMALTIPTTYTCSTNCWWTLRDSYDGGTPQSPQSINDRVVAIGNVSGPPSS